MTAKSPDNDDIPRDPSMLNVAKDDTGNVGDDSTAAGLAPEQPPTEGSLVKAPMAPDNEAAPLAEEAPATKEVKEQRKEINPKFKDLKDTGQWGDISKREMIAVAIFGLLVVVGLVVGVSIAATRGDGEDSPKPLPPRPTESPTVAPTDIGQELQFSLVFDAMSASDLTAFYSEELPQEVEAYEGLMDDPEATPQERAMSWLLFEDNRDSSTEVAERWALASLYYSWQGGNWVSAENWLSSEKLCEWEHVTCNLQTGNIQEIDLQSNNLIGTIPPELVLLNTTQALWLRTNQLSGPLPNEIFGSMPRLSILYLDDNALTGSVSTSIRGNQVLSKSSHKRPNPLQIL